jgi:hypothetical protein
VLSVLVCVHAGSHLSMEAEWIFVWADDRLALPILR